MRPSKSLKSLKFLLAIFLMVLCSNVFANTGPRETKEPKKQEQIQNANLQQEPDEAESNEEDGVEEGVTESDESISNSSFNYFFYLIYKIKFEDVFRLPSRNISENGVDIHRVNIGALIERFTNPNF